MLDLIVRLVPVSIRALIVTFVAFEALIALAAVMLVIALYDDPWDELHLTILTALVISGPVVLTMLASLRHQKQLQARLIRLASTDMLTGLPNRRAFLEQIAPEGALVQDGALVLADADHFKRINDTHGHDVGDVCLVALAAHLTDLLTSGDLVARYGGEEFALFCKGADIQRLRHLEAAICGPLTVPREDGAEALRVTLSAGAVLAQKGASSILAYREADRALYDAKSAGRERLVISQARVTGPDPA